jgi:hypothetical protein
MYKSLKLICVGFLGVTYILGNGFQPGWHGFNETKGDLSFYLVMAFESEFELILEWKVYLLNAIPKMST